ncbi:hypothetical protein SAMN05660690_0831 [Geodermatophilus telluris]|uniref:Uncharacterized protein n=1 Tax=Geodermatophilus telluris TaxID=1190417 RepID=A0A1G6JHM9_9ACTN|nr:hypothetical protein [Geodermatophilus telluris]SDC18181.1 hypothetical protein SAMN05660690_0831 [Geodermatophilus telluris]
MTSWSIALAVAAAVLGLAGLTMSVLGYLDIQREKAKPSTWHDVGEIRELIGDSVVGANLWRTYLAVGLTAASVVVGAASSITGSLAN